MRLLGLAVALGLVAWGCGSSPPPAAATPEPPPPVVAKRVSIEDSTEPEEGVTIVNAHGHMESAAVEAGLQPHHEELSACYMKNPRLKQWIGGHVLIHWNIKKDGTITSVKLMGESNLGSWPIEKCLIEVARSASFDKPIGGDADFTLPLDFTAKASSLPWTEDQALRAVGGQLVKLDRCDQKNGKPRDLTITLYVGPRGKAQSIGFSSDSSEIKDKWAECAEKQAMAWRLPDPRGTVAKLAVKRP
jgi:hypothetical protein